jgi:hypothetical protein
MQWLVGYGQKNEPDPSANGKQAPFFAPVFRKPYDIMRKRAKHPSLEVWRERNIL